MQREETYRGFTITYLHVGERLGAACRLTQNETEGFAIWVPFSDGWEVLEQKVHAAIDADLAKED